MSSIPARNLYGKYGDPNKVAEFRLFSFNNCKSGCKNCFYNKSKNDFFSFDQATRLATELENFGYHLETCYLLPTDAFDNQFNYNILKSADLNQTLKKFDFLGIATTMENGYDPLFFDTLFTQLPDIGVEIHLNLLEEKLSSPEYFLHLKSQIEKLKVAYGDHILVNLAVNCGSEHTALELGILNNFVTQLSDDRILELNFTFLFNTKLDVHKKRNYLIKSLPLIRYLSSEFKKNETELNSRTFLRKPSFTFKDDKIYSSPIIPFDEYIFLDSPAYQMEEPTMDSFLKVYNDLEKLNKPILAACNSCEYLSYCAGKMYFPIAHEYDIGCVKGLA